MTDKKSLNVRAFELLVAAIITAIGLVVIAAAIKEYYGAAVAVTIIAILVCVIIRQRRSHRRALENAQTSHIRHDIHFN